MAHPNLREMDVALSLVGMAHVPGVNQNTNATVGAQTQHHQQEHTARPAQTTRHRIRRAFKTEESHPDNQNGATRQSYYPYAPIQPAIPTPMPHHTPTLDSAENGNQALQRHLLRQQLLAGVPPENLLPIPQANVNVQRTPALIQITNQGISVPRVPPAIFVPGTPAPPYSWNPKSEEKTINAPAGQFLTVPDDGYNNQTPPFERPPPAFRENPVGNIFGSSGGQAYHPATLMSANPAALSGYGYGTYTPQGYFEPPTNTLNPNEGYNFGSYPLVKGEPDADQEQLNMLNHPPHTSNAGFSGHNYGLYDISNIKYEDHPAATQPYPIGRTPDPYGLGHYEAINTQNGAMVQTVENVRGPQVIGWSHPQQPTTDTAEDFYTAPLNDQAFIKEQPMLKHEVGGHTVNKIGDRSDFNILFALLDHPEIAVQLTGELRVQDLLNLQATSRTVRTFVVRHLPRIIRLQALRRSRTASCIFPWRCYQKLWFKRIVINDEIQPFSIANRNESIVAYTASFRWLQMLRSRERTVHSIVTALVKAGYGFPYRYKSAIFKLWFLMDIPDTRRRLWTVQNHNLWTDLDIFMAILFIIRIDMYVKIERGNHTGGQRRLIMAQRNLHFCQDVLTGRALRDDMELLNALIRWRYNPRPDEILAYEVFGVPANEVGSLQYEGYGKGRGRNAKLRRPDELVLREADRRGLNYQEMYRRIFIYAQPQAFTQCERPNSIWDQEVRLVARGSDVPIHQVLRLD